MLTYVDKASKKDCLIVAESLIRRYPFMKEPVCSSLCRESFFMFTV